MMTGVAAPFPGGAMYAQFDTDEVIARLFPEDFVGTYLDIGAHDPVVGSNTFLFYLRGWRGVTIEPTVENFEGHRRARPRDVQLDYAISDECGLRTFFECTERSVSTLDPVEADLRRRGGQGVAARMVPVMTVRALVESDSLPPWLGVPDLLSIDVEGHERAVLEGCPFDAGWLPRVLVLEACRPCTAVPCHEDWDGIIIAHGYQHVETAGVNRIYICR